MFKPVSELAGLVRSGQVSAPELVETALRRIEALDPALGAFVECDPDGALEAAAATRPGDDRPYAGVPIAIKGNTPVAGMLLTQCSRFLADHRPDHSAYLVRRLRNAGFIIVGTTKLPEFGILPTTEPRYGGPARNPWDHERTPGGSSGGAAAAVASGMVPIAHGNDGAGSIRIPAACCGLVGLKPSRGRVSKGPDAGESLLGCDGVLTRTVADTALALDVLAGYEVGDANWAPRPVEPYATAVRRDPGRLRIGFTTANALNAPVDAECERGLHDAAELLASLGHDVVEVDPPLPGAETLGLFIGVFGAGRALDVSYGRTIAGREPDEDDIEPLSRALYDMAAGMSSTDYLAAVAQLQLLARSVVALFADFDLLMTPALAERPLPIGECTGYGEHPLDDLGRSGVFTPYTALFNVTGQPAISVPIGFGPDDLPTGVQIAAPPLGEDTLLQVAAQMEAARPWSARRPEPVGSAA